MTITVANKYKITPQDGDVYIGRGSPFGNPFIIGKHGTREEVIEMYRDYINDWLSDPINKGILLYIEVKKLLD